MNIAKSSPLYGYWNSSQEEEDEKIRLLKFNSSEPASNLFKNEPYKWENLYQSVLRNVIAGDESSMKALMILLSTITKKEKEKTLMFLKDILDESVIYKLRNGKYHDMNTSRNLYTSLRILINIFINPYGIEIKKDKNHIYEKTGMFFHRLRKVFFLNNSDS